VHGPRPRRPAHQAGGRGHGTAVRGCTGDLRRALHVPAQYFANREIDELVEAFVHDIEEGIQGTDVKAAFLKSAVDEPGITEDVEKVFARARARASGRVGRSCRTPIRGAAPASSRWTCSTTSAWTREGRDRPHRRHRQPRVHRGAALTRLLHRHGPLRDRPLPHDRAAQRDGDRAVQARSRREDECSPRTTSRRWTGSRPRWSLRCCRSGASPSCSTRSSPRSRSPAWADEAGRRDDGGRAAALARVGRPLS